MPLPMQQKQKTPGKWGKASKQLSFWVLLVLLAGTLFTYMSGAKEAAPQISYTQYNQEVERGNVAAVTMQEGKLVTGDFRTRVQINNRPASRFTVLLPIKDSDREVTRLQEKGVQIRAERESTSFGSVLFMILPYVIIFGAWMLILRQMQAGGAKAFSFGKSKAKLLTADSPKVTFADVAGADEAKIELEEIIEFLKDPQKFTKLGGRLPKGALLVGPPGTGKTLLARAVAGEAGRPFFSMSGSDFVEMFVGVGASRVRDLFEQGKAHAPCIIFIDEIDAVGRHRGAGLGGGHDEREQTLNQLLVEMDGFESNDGVILIAATNRPDVLDPALLRPGRFDRQIVVDSPDVRGREGILRVHTRKIPLAADVRLDSLAKGTPGMAGADLANLVNEAAVLAARRNKTLVDMQDFEDAKDKVMLGVERRSLVLTEDDRKLTAYHEAGHTVVSLQTPGADPIHKVTIVPRGRALGLMTSLPETDRYGHTKEFLLGRLSIAFGGRVAEELVFGQEKITTGAGSDIQFATNVARQMVTVYGMSEKVGMMAVGDKEQEIFLGREFSQKREISERTQRMVDEEVKRLLDEAHSHARELLTAHRELLDRIALALLERETLDSEDVLILLRGETLPPRIEHVPLPSYNVKPGGPAPAVRKPPILGAPPAEPAGA